VSARLAFALRVSAKAFDVDVDVESDARTLGLFGPSGAGKTTVLEALAGWRAVERGRIRLGDVTWLDTETRLFVPPRRRGVGYVPQDLLLFPHLSVLDNLRAGLRRGFETARVERVIEVLELGPLRDRSVDTLSGGERQRTALGRALCREPILLLLDEPLASLDRALRRRILPYLLRVRDELDTPMVLVSHDPTEIAALCEDVALIERGRVVARGTPEEVFANDRGWRATGGEYENVLRGVIRSVEDATATLDLDGATLEVPAGDLPVGVAAVVTVRADEILVATERPRGLSARNVVPARVVRVVTSADDVRLLASLASSSQTVWIELTAGAVRELALAPGRNAFLVMKTRSLRAFSAARDPANVG